MAKLKGPIRYAIVGLGHISQVAMLPAFANASRNSRVTALVSDDPAKLKTLGRKYNVASTYSYADYEACLAEVDAVYIGLPNSLHEEYTLRAARAGVHVLCEKPLAVTVAECERMVKACRDNGVKLMTAYRLHFEALSLKVIELVRSGKIGEPKFFTSSFSMTVYEGNIRTKAAMGGGSLYDIGVYCINAARYLFRAEPRQVMALSVNSGGKKFAEIDESTGSLLRFEGERLASFVTSFNAANEGSYQIVGTKGAVHVDPAFKYELIIGGKKKKVTVPKRDQFAAQLRYFSDCIINNRTPEPSGEEGLQDVRIVQALYKSAATGKAVALPPFKKTSRPGDKQRIARPGVKKARLKPEA
jgi:predicted dehydrogenase